MKKLLALSAVLLLAASVSFAQAPPNTYQGTTTLSVTVGNEAAIQVQTTPAFGSVGIFGDYTATTPFTYWVRTTNSGKITLQVTTDFSTGGTGGGPSVATPPTTGDALTYTSTAVGPVTGSATPVTTALTASTTVATTVVDFGATTQSAKTGNAGTVSWNLTNDPSYKAGSYQATVTFTISAS